WRFVDHHYKFDKANKVIKVLNTPWSKAPAGQLAQPETIQKLSYDAAGRLFSQLRSDSLSLYQRVWNEAKFENGNQVWQFHREFGVDAAGHIRTQTEEGIGTVVDINGELVINSVGVATRTGYDYDQFGNVIDTIRSENDGTGPLFHDNMATRKSRTGAS